MHQAPAVSFPVKRPIRAGWAIVAVWMTGVITAICFGLNEVQAFWMLPAALSVSLVAGVSALIQWWKSPVGELRWDRSQWVFVATKNSSGESLSVFDVSVALDFQSTLLVRFRTPLGQQNWFWLECKSDLAAWRILRRAIFARPRKSAVVEPVAISPARSSLE